MISVRNLVRVLLTIHPQTRGWAAALRVLNEIAMHRIDLDFPLTLRDIRDHPVLAKILGRRAAKIEKEKGLS